MRHSLLSSVRERRLFNPTKEEDLRELKVYVDTNQWTAGCPFLLEENWDNIPAMCMHKYAKHMLSSLKSKKQKSPK